MALSFSRGALKRFAVGQDIITKTRTTYALVDGGTGADTITDSSNSFITDGFVNGMRLNVIGATDPADNVTNVPIVSVTAGTITLPTGTFTAGETAGASITLATALGGSFANIFNGGTLHMLSGTRRAYAKDAGTGTVLVSYTDVEITNTITWDGVNLRQEFGLANALIAKGLAGAGDGTVATWFCLCAKTNGTVHAWNTVESDDTIVRVDGSVGGSESFDIYKSGGITVVYDKTQSIESLSGRFPMLRAA